MRSGINDGAVRGNCGGEVNKVAGTERRRQEAFAAVRAAVAVALAVRGDATIEAYDSAPVAQLDRAIGFEPIGRGFESLRARHINFVRTGHIGNRLVLRRR